MATSSLSRNVLNSSRSLLLGRGGRLGLSYPARYSTTEKTPEETPENNEALKECEAKLCEMSEKYEDVLDKYRRSLAESDNMRKRLNKQIEDERKFGNQKFSKDLLEVADVLSMAVESVDPSKIESHDLLRDMHQGLKLTESQLLQVFKRHGLEKITPLKEKFDPNFHEALFQIPAPEGVDANVVLDVQKPGYVLNGRVIRPAKVGVSK